MPFFYRFPLTGTPKVGHFDVKYSRSLNFRKILLFFSQVCKTVTTSRLSVFLPITRTCWFFPFFPFPFLFFFFPFFPPCPSSWGHLHSGPPVSCNFNRFRSLFSSGPRLNTSERFGFFLDAKIWRIPALDPFPCLALMTFTLRMRIFRTKINKKYIN